MALARAALTRGYPRNFETAEQIARSVAQLALYGLPDDYFEQFVPTIAALELDALARVAQRTCILPASWHSSSATGRRLTPRWGRCRSARPACCAVAVR